MNTDRIEGSVDKTVGKAQEAAGRVLDNDEMRAEGMARQASGAVQDLYGQACDQIKGVACDVAKKVEQNPLAALAVAGVVGYLLGLASRSRH